MQCQCLDLPGPLVECVGVDLPLDDIPGVRLVTVDDVGEVRGGEGRLGAWCGRDLLQTVGLLLAGLAGLALLRLGLVDRPAVNISISASVSQSVPDSHLIAESGLSWEEPDRLGENCVW